MQHSKESLKATTIRQLFSCLSSMVSEAYTNMCVGIQRRHKYQAILHQRNARKSSRPFSTRVPRGYSSPTPSAWHTDSLLQQQARLSGIPPYQTSKYMSRQMQGLHAQASATQSQLLRSRAQQLSDLYINALQRNDHSKVDYLNSLAGLTIGRSRNRI